MCNSVSVINYEMDMLPVMFIGTTNSVSVTRSNVLMPSVLCFLCYFCDGLSNCQVV
jgi:hypothetical protein